MMRVLPSVALMLGYVRSRRTPTSTASAAPSIGRKYSTTPAATPGRSRIR